VRCCLLGHEKGFPCGEAVWEKVFPLGWEGGFAVEDDVVFGMEVTSLSPAGNVFAGADEVVVGIGAEAGGVVCPKVVVSYEARDGA
jgi:hypothetical protein